MVLATDDVGTQFVGCFYLLEVCTVLGFNSACLCDQPFDCLAELCQMGIEGVLLVQYLCVLPLQSVVQAKNKCMMMPEQSLLVFLNSLSLKGHGTSELLVLALHHCLTTGAVDMLVHKLAQNHLLTVLDTGNSVFETLRLNV